MCGEPNVETCRPSFSRGGFKQRLQRYPDLRVVADLPEAFRSNRDCGLRAAHRIQWRDRAGVSPASRAQTRSLALMKAARVFLVFAVLLNGCTSAPPPRRAAPHVQRIVSLVPSLTEDLFAIGAGERIVAVTQADDFPPSVRRLPAVASFSSVNNEAIVRLHPDLVVGIPSQERLTASLRAAGITTIFLRDDTYGDIFADISALGALTSHRIAAAVLINGLHAKTRRLQRSLHRTARRPQVLFVVNVRPIIVAGQGSFISTLLRLSGAQNAVRIPQAYPTISAEAVLRAQPNAIVTDDQTQLRAVLGASPWRVLRAVKRGNVFVLDKRHADVVERPGPRYNAGLAWLIAHLHALR